MSSPKSLLGLRPIPRGIPPDLEKHIVAVKWLLGAYLLLLIVVWYLILHTGSEPSTTAQKLPFWLGGLVYVALIIECTIVQQRLFAAGLGKHRGWQVAVGGLILNPCFLGWWIPASVLLAVRRAR